MRILHTADWHFGKMLEGRDRHPEQQAFVDELVRICEDEAVDVIMMAGDVYQTVNPSAEAEDLFYEALDRLADHGRRAVVVIAGNHDNPERLEAPAPLADRLGVTLIGFPKTPLEPWTPTDASRVARTAAGPSWISLWVPRCQQATVIAALPYPSEARLQEMLVTVLADEAALQANYQARIQTIYRELARHFQADTVNLAMGHVFVQSGIETDSEIQIQVGGAYAVDLSVFPGEAQYVGLGHLHRPQWMGTDERIRYAGSPLAYSFSEAGHAKSVTILDAAPSVTPQIREVPLSAGKPLVRWTARQGISQVYQWLDEGRDAHAWVDLELHISDSLRLSDIQQLRSLHPGLIHIRPILPMDPEATEVPNRDALSIEQLFCRFYESKHLHPPDARTVELFLSLVSESMDETDGAADAG